MGRKISLQLELEWALELKSTKSETTLSLQWRHHETAMTVKTHYLHLTALYKANATSRNAVTFRLAPISEYVALFP